MSFTSMMANSTLLNPLIGGQIDFSPWLAPKYAISYGLVVFSLIGVSFAKLLGKSQPRLIPGVYVVGGSKKREIRETTARFRDESKELILNGYRHTDGKEPFYVPSALGPRLILPTRYMEELKSAPIDKVDFIGTVHESKHNISHCILMLAYTGEGRY